MFAKDGDLRDRAFDKRLQPAIRFAHAIGRQPRRRAADAAVHREGVRRARPIPEPLGGPLGRRADVIQPACRQQAAEEAAMRPEAAVLDKPGRYDFGRRSPGDGDLADPCARDVEAAVDHDLDRDAVVLQQDAADAALPAVAARDEVGGHRLPGQPDAAGECAGGVDPVEAPVGGGVRHPGCSRNRCASGRGTTFAPRFPASGW